MSKEKVTFTIDDSKIVELFGLQNFAKVESALLELIKNAYDAKAKSVKLIFRPNLIQIIDDGEGMTQQTIRNYWMHVGKSGKNTDFRVNISENETRTLAGSKGIGRFAIARIGGKAKVFSHSKEQTPIIWETDWNDNYIEETNEELPVGTCIEITDLRDKWNEKTVEKITNYLSKCKNYQNFNIVVDNFGKVFECQNPFLNIAVGKNCLTKFDIAYDADSQELAIELISDEFDDEVARIISNDLICKDIDIHRLIKTYNVKKLLSKTKYSDEDLDESLSKIGNFLGTFFFNNMYNESDAKLFKYKRKKALPSFNEKGTENGVVLYRNAFCIAGYDGSVDWLEFGKRSRSSPAAASHPTGTWRVRENQICGEIFIDREFNILIEEMQNRQGITDNIYFQLFKSIIIEGIKVFEIHRQSIIRSIRKNNDDDDTVMSKDVDDFIKNPDSIKTKEPNEVKALAQSVAEERKRFAEKEKKYHEEINNARYDVRLLNALSTIGLKSSWKAHDLNNEKRNMLSTPGYIIEALDEFGFWDILNDKEHTKKESTNIPKMIDSIENINMKVANFIDSTLQTIEKNKFKIKRTNPKFIIDTVCNKWKKECTWISIKVNSDEETFLIAEDVIETILNNLILNSIQQNNSSYSPINPLKIEINCFIVNECLEMEYHDQGKGLDERYKDDPRKILEPHETTRENGHGLGMWIVNNTAVNSGGEIFEIKGDDGFYIRLRLRSENNANF